MQRCKYSTQFMLPPPPSLPNHHLCHHHTYKKIHKLKDTSSVPLHKLFFPLPKFICPPPPPPQNSRWPIYMTTYHDPSQQ